MMNNSCICTCPYARNSQFSCTTRMWIHEKTTHHKWFHKGSAQQEMGGGGYSMQHTWRNKHVPPTRQPANIKNMHNAHGTKRRHAHDDVIAAASLPGRVGQRAPTIHTACMPFNAIGLAHCISSHKRATAGCRRRQDVSGCSCARLRMWTGQDGRAVCQALGPNPACRTAKSLKSSKRCLALCVPP